MRSGFRSSRQTGMVLMTFCCHAGDLAMLCTTFLTEKEQDHLLDFSHSCRKQLGMSRLYSTFESTIANALGCMFFPESNNMLLSLTGDLLGEVGLYVWYRDAII